MKNILILYNPYYQENVIEQHLEILKEKGVVAFGKIRSQLRDYDSPNEEQLNVVYKSVSKETPLQLFLTDYNSMYVANVISIKSEKTKIVKTPDYYDNLDVEEWFIFDDLRLLVLNDFQHIRDNILANFKAINYNNHTYTLYGNNYVYPMQVTMKEKIDYFEKEDEDFKYFTNIFKSSEQIKMKQNLIDFCFGEKKFYNFNINTQDNIISAEIEYMGNKQNLLYDFSSIVVKYSKAVEKELYIFMKSFFYFLIKEEPIIRNFPYTVQGKDYILENIFHHKPNYGTYKYLIKSFEIKEAINKYITINKLKYFISQEIIQYISIIQEVRNESVHGSITSLESCNKIRKNVLGIGESSILSELQRYKKFLIKANEL